MSCKIRRILTFRSAIKFAEIKILDLDGNNMTKIFAYSWSSDGICWTNWTSYKDYTRLAKHIESDFYLRILVEGSIGSVYVGDHICSDYSIAIEESKFIPISSCDDNENLFQPYSGLDCALLLQQQLSDLVICMLGIPVYYFRVEPVKDSLDYTFKEYILHGISSVKQIKLMIQGGEMPSSNPHLSDYGFDWEVDWEVEISKSAFAAAFGDNSVPKQRDIIWVPLMKRMWMVNSAYDEKKDGLLWRSTTWKLALRKYEDNQNFEESDFDNLVDSLIIQSHDDTRLEVHEQARLTGYDQIQAPEYAANNLTDIFIADNIRQSYTKDDIEVQNGFICDGNTIIARNSYKFLNTNGTIVYQKGICGDSGTISMIIRTPGPTYRPDESESYTLAKFGPIEFEFMYDPDSSNMYLGVGNLYSEVECANTYLLIYRWNKSTVTQELNIYHHYHDGKMPSYLVRPESYHFETNNPVYEGTEEYNQDYNLGNNQEPCILTGYPCEITNIKYYNRYSDVSTSIRESFKYITNDPKCVFADLARPITAGRGFGVR